MSKNLDMVNFIKQAGIKTNNQVKQETIKVAPEEQLLSSRRPETQSIQVAPGGGQPIDIATVAPAPKVATPMIDPKPQVIEEPSFINEVQVAKPKRESWDIELPTDAKFGGAFDNVGKKEIKRALNAEEVVLPNGKYMSEITGWSEFAAKPKNNEPTKAHYLTITHKIIDGAYTEELQTDFNVLFKKDGSLNKYTILKLNKLFILNGVEIDESKPIVAELSRCLDALRRQQFNINIKYTVYKEKPQLTLYVESKLA